MTGKKASEEEKDFIGKTLSRSQLLTNTCGNLRCVNPEHYKVK